MEISEDNRRCWTLRQSSRSRCKGIHDGNQKSGSVVGYGQAIRLKNINFGSDPKTALDIARGKRLVQATGEDAPKPQGKATIARIFGEYQSADPYDLQRQAADIIESGSEIKAFLISLPSEVFIGMFCKFGALDDNLPVEVLAIPKDV